MRSNTLCKLFLVALWISIPRTGFPGAESRMFNTAGGIATAGQTSVQISVGQAGGVGTLSGGSIAIEAGFLHSEAASTPLRQRRSLPQTP
jgi:hypothetical protein